MMTNAQAALLAAAPMARTRREAELAATELLLWLNAQDAAQEAASAPQADDHAPVTCKTCGRTITPSRLAPWSDVTGLWGTATHEHRP